MENNLNKVKKIRNRAKRLSRRIMSFALVLISVVSIAAVPGTQVDAADKSNWMKDAFLKGTAVSMGKTIVNASETFNGGFFGGAGSAAGSWLVDTALNWFTGQDYGTTNGKATSHVNSGSFNKVVKNYKVYNDNRKTNYNTEKNYSFYNPVTNTYNHTDNYYYNQEYNTFYYDQRTYNEYTSNYYTTNYYTTVNNNYVSYYIITYNGEDESSGIASEEYYEIYFELPDGRSSYGLTREEIWGIPMVYDYTQYENIPEDDGTTLGLWHLDGDTKDSSSWNNTAGSSYTTSYKEGRFEQGKYFNDSGEDFLELKLDKSDFDPSQPFTLEWIQKTTGSGDISSSSIYSINKYEFGNGIAHSYAEQNNFTFNKINLSLINKNYGIVGFNDTVDESCFFPISSFVSCAIVFDGSNYNFFSNGNLMFTCNDLSESGLTINDNSIEFKSLSVFSDIYDFNTSDNKIYSEFSHGIEKDQSDAKDGLWPTFFNLVKSSEYYKSVQKCTADRQNFYWYDFVCYQCTANMNSYNVLFDCIIVNGR